MNAALVGEQRVGLGIAIAAAVVLACYYLIKLAIWLAERREPGFSPEKIDRALDDGLGDAAWFGSLREPPPPSTRDRVLYKPNHVRRPEPVQRRRDANKRARAARRVTRSRG